MNEKIRVLIVDDHQMVRMGLATLLSTAEEIEVVGEARDGIEGVKLALALRPHVILMDLVMEGMNGIEATREIMAKAKELNWEVKILVLTSFIEDQKVMAALEAGAFSYLLKTSSGDTVLEAIKKAVANEPVLESQVTKVIISQAHKKPEKHHCLTQRELEVLQLIGEGKSNKEIGEALFIGIKTVKTHVSNILAKLELEDRTKAAIYANQHQIGKNGQ